MVKGVKVEVGDRVGVNSRAEVDRVKPSHRIGNICQTMTKRRTT